MTESSRVRRNPSRRNGASRGGRGETASSAALCAIREGTLDLEHIRDLDDAEVIKQITAVKGLGEWSAHMFLMFHLGRPDVLPIGDLGVRSGMKLAYGLEESPTPKQALEIGAKWAPYRSVGSWYMWRAVPATRPTTPDI